MNTPKKILLLIGSIFFVGLVAFGIAWAVSALFSLNFWAVFIIITALQLAYPKLEESYIFSKNVKDSIKEYASKPYRKYEIPLTCQYCGHSEVVDVDLNNTTYKCATCERKNAVYVSFMTAIIQNE